MNRTLSLLSLSAAVFGLVVVGCGGSTPAPETPAASEAPSPAGERDVQLTPSTPATGESCELRTVYFGFDDAGLNQTSKDSISASVECFRRNGAPTNLHLTGATDPRGTEEYNLALGERRAQAVRTYLISLGVEADKIGVSSVGHEMANGTDESGWQQDRRVTNQ